MLSRYQNHDINQIWSKEHQISVWLKIEILVAKYWNQKGLFNNQIMQKINHLKSDYSRLLVLEKDSQHETIAFIMMLSEQLESQEAKWIHYGLTSNDILDTGQNYLLKKTCCLIEDKLSFLLKILKKLAWQEKDTLSLGRTHGMPAEPITIGFKFALWFYELENHLQRLQQTREEINYAKILGPTGMSVHFSLELNDFVAKNLGMKAIKIANQLMSRDHLIALFNCLTNLATSIEKMAMEIRNLHRHEINEINESFTNKQKGSSAMPHKKNPILSENICGLVRYLRNMSQSFYETNLLWHERDLTNSSIERIAVVDFFHLLMTVLKRFTYVVDNLQINYSQIKNNLAQQKVAVFSHRVLLTLIKESKLDRQEAYQLVQKASFQATKNNQDFEESLKTVGILKYLSVEELKSCFDNRVFVKNIDAIFKRIFT